MIVEIEQESGVSWCTARTPAEADALREQSLRRAAAALRTLADELEATDPQRAQQLRAVAQDPQRTTAERWGAYKNDRQPREQELAPTDEKPLEGRQR